MLIFCALPDIIQKNHSLVHFSSINWLFGHLCDISILSSLPLQCTLHIRFCGDYTDHGKQDVCSVTKSYYHNHDKKLFCAVFLVKFSCASNMFYKLPVCSFCCSNFSRKFSFARSDFWASFCGICNAKVWQPVLPSWQLKCMSVLSDWQCNIMVVQLLLALLVTILELAK